MRDITPTDSRARELRRGRQLRARGTGRRAAMSLRVSAAEADHLRAAAGAAGLLLGEWLRAAVLAAAEKPRRK